ncbi:DUF2244 domain-containing protein [Candidatus Accumulibacter phosphatis]|jgi:uncharacterized membrane protein|uniref:DUF2244 domain-containing protein n=1 Tax=Candidatus Accumulibacter phosphatis TaxID=327160 RepID=A0ABX1TTB3_9PROT|nr:DUF2244 domain-containing protein [Candidatus Accumulibacter phosphatis]NMQ26498.1 DUF2244 domain-containing protein [Candidatus Accumulibacter phosphatis]
MSVVAARTATAQTWEARRDYSLSVSERKWVFLATATWLAAIAITFSYFGAWPILPFTGLELALLWWALRQIDATTEDFERITLEAELLTIETRRGTLLQRHAFHPYWAQLQFDQPPGQQQRLLIRSHGKEVEVGRWLSEEQKRALGNELKKNLGALRPERTL